MKRFGLFSIACVMAVTLACNTSETRNDQTNAAPEDTIGTTGEAEQRNTPTTGDRDFLQDALVGNMAEVDLGKMAAERASSADIKRFGQMLVADHTKSADALKAIAAQHNITVDTQMDEPSRELAKRLSALRGAEFDREFMDAIVDKHEDSVDMLQSRVDTKASFKDQVTGAPARDTNVQPEAADNHIEMSLNQWAAKALPTVRQHLEQAKQIQDKVENTRNTTARN